MKRLLFLFHYAITISMEKKDFYDEISKMLGLNTDYKQPYHGCNRPNRWNNRNPGNGRFEGYGYIKYFSAGMIHIVFHSPKKVNIIATSEKEAFDIVRQCRVV